MGFVTEVKDQVWNTSISRQYWPKSRLQQTLFAGLLWFLLGLQHHGSYWGSVVQEDRSAHIPKWAEPGGLLQDLRHLRLQRSLDGQRLRLRGQQRFTVDEHLPVHLSGKDLPGLPVSDNPLLKPAITWRHLISFCRTPSRVIMTAVWLLLTSGTTGSLPRETSRLWQTLWPPLVRSQWPSTQIIPASCFTARVYFFFGHMSS